jgi:hypothetical protein
MITCKECGKVITHESGFCLQHRHGWREGFKEGIRTRESVGDKAIDLLIRDLEMTSKHPVIKHMGLTPLMIRSANAIRRLSK